MKKLFVIFGAAALILTGCNQGGTSDQYGTSSGNVNSNSNSVNRIDTNMPVTP